MIRSDEAKVDKAHPIPSAEGGRESAEYVLIPHLYQITLDT